MMPQNSHTGAGSGLSGLFGSSSQPFKPKTGPFPPAIRYTHPSPHLYISPLTSYVSRPLNGKVISQEENGILYGQRVPGHIVLGKARKGIHEFNRKYLPIESI
jgi:hypothetical protein